MTANIGHKFVNVHTKVLALILSSPLSAENIEVTLINVCYRSGDFGF